MLSLITDHGRATPLVWLTVDKRTLKDNRSLLRASRAGAAGRTAAEATSRCAFRRRPRLRRPEAYRVLTEELCFDYVIRFRGNIAVTVSMTGENRCRLGAIRRTRQACCAASKIPPIAIRWGTRRLRSGPRHEKRPAAASSKFTATATIDTMPSSLGYRVWAARYR